MCIFIGIQEVGQFFLTFITHLFYVFPHLCQAVDAINSRVFLQVYRKISLLIIGYLIASETACPIKILTSFRRNLNIRWAEIICVCSRDALIVAALAPIWDRCIIMEYDQQKSKEIQLLLRKLWTQIITQELNCSPLQLQFGPEALHGSV